MRLDLINLWGIYIVEVLLIVFLDRPVKYNSFERRQIACTLRSVSSVPFHLLTFRLAFSCHRDIWTEYWFYILYDSDSDSDWKDAGQLLLLHLFANEIETDTISLIFKWTYRLHAVQINIFDTGQDFLRKFVKKTFSLWFKVPALETFWRSSIAHNNSITIFSELKIWKAKCTHFPQPDLFLFSSFYHWQKSNNKWKGRKEKKNGQPPSQIP